MSETMVIFVEVLIAVYLIAGLYLASTLRMTNENAADSQTLLLDFFLVLFWVPYLLIKLKNRRVTAIILALTFMLPILYFIL